MVNPGTKNAVLIDFDHAEAMEPGCATPHHLERVGTGPFIAMDLARSPELRLQRLFHHDLESALWCMLWYCKEQPDWTRGSFTNIFAGKWSWLRSADPSVAPPGTRNGAAGLWEPIVNALRDWMFIDERVPGYPEPTSDRGWIEVIDNRFPCPPELGLDWMSFEVGRVRRKDRRRS